MVRTAIGIDLGTTISVVAHAESDGTVEVLDNLDGQPLTPSVVYFEGPHSVVVGREAKQQAPVSPDRVVTAIKRWMGQDLTLTFDGVPYGPEGISAIILKALARSAGRELGVDDSELVAVVTVPAHFGATEREATASAAAIAGLEILELVAEPVAATLSYGLPWGDRGSVLVYDLGGGTFDATVIDVTAGGPIVASVDGASRLGGVDFDQRLGDLLIERYTLATGDDEAADDEEFLLQVYADAEDVKKKLSSAERATVMLNRAGRGSRIGVARAEFEEVTSTLIIETLTVVDRAIAAAVAKGVPSPSQVVLTGGSTRMPAVADALRHHLAIPVRLHDPDMAVAKGAAIHCRTLMHRSEAVPALLPSSSAHARRILQSSPLRSVLPRALGVKLHDSNDPAGQRIFVQHMVAANTPLPVNPVQATFATVFPGQQRVRIEVMEQAGALAAPELEFNRRILHGEFTGLPDGLPAGSPIDFRLSVGTDGRIACTARERGTGAELVLESYMDGVADNSQAQGQRRAVAGLLVKE